MLHFTITFFLITLFTGKVTSKLNDNSGSGNEAVNEMDLSNQEEFEDNIPLHESYRSRHKYKLGTGHQDFNKRFVDINNTLKGMKDSQCAIMYKDNEPVGILQPFEESYRFLPIQGEPTYVEINPVPAKRRTVLDILYPTEFTDDYNEEKFSNTAKFADDRYPSIFAKFKISSRLDKSSKEATKKKSNFKRALSFDNPDLDPVKSTLNNEEETVDIGKNVGIDENISVEEHAGVEEKLKNILDDMGLIDDYPNQEVKDIKREVEDENLELGTNKINLVKEGKAETRKRREDKTDNPGVIDTNIASKETADAERKFKRFENDMPVLDCTTVAFKGSRDVDDYEKRVEREIRERIQQLKEEVKKEISNLTKSDDDTRRKKRQIVNTLMDEETNDINPTYNIEETEKPLIRKKRTAEFDNNETNNNNINNRDNLEQTKRKVDDINAVDSFDDEPKTSELENNQYSQNTRKQECSCDKNDADCKCDESNPNRRLYKFQYNKDIGMKNQKRSKQVCSCDKNGNNCKCENTLKETIPSLADKNYSEYYDLGDDYNEDSDLALKSVNSISALHEDNQYLTDNEYENDDYTNNDKFEKRAIKPRKFAINKPMESGEYFVDFQPDTYNLSPRDTFRKKRDKYDFNIFKNGQPHLVSFKQQDSMSPHSRYRRRILREENNLAPRQLIDMSDEDLFGALPQTFDGELLRYKRIRRSSRNRDQQHLQ